MIIREYLVQRKEKKMPVLIKPEPFSPVLLASVPLPVTSEQINYIREILDVACSDSRFADKAYDAIRFVLTGQTTVPPVVTSLNPATVVIGSPAFDIHVMGTGFTPASVIMFAGLEEPTVFVSETELTTGVNMPLWTNPADVPVAVLNGGVLSDPMTFSFTSVVVLSTGKQVVPEENKTPVHKTSVQATVKK
jgi:hypothetical protein